MSFGYGVGDVIAVSNLARTIWGRFRDASDQFKAIRTEVAGLGFVLDDIASSLPKLQLTDKQARDLSDLVNGCSSVLDDTGKLIRKNESLGTESSGLGSKTQKTWKKLKWDSATVNELRDRMVSSTTYLNTFSTSLASQVSRAMNDKVDIIVEDTQNLRLNQSQQKREDVLQWLSPIDFAPQQNDLSSRRQEGTGSWLLESREFQEWVSKEGGTLVCQGMPGAGKTMLASLVIDHLQRLPREESVVTAYIFCDYKRQDEQTPINLAATIAKQLLQHQVSIPEDILKTYERHHQQKTRPNIEEVLEMTGSSMAHLSRLYLIVDALDELGNAGQARQSLIERLRPLQDLHQFNLMTTSRYIPSLAADFHQPVCMDIQASPEDIRRYVEGHISDLPNCVRKNLGLQDTIASAIVDAVEGMFLLAQLHMDSLRYKGSPKLIKKALEILPTGSDALDLAYRGAMQRVEDQGFRLLAKQLLGWLTYSARLMTVREVQYALSIEPETPDFDEDSLVDVGEIVGFCAGLVIIDEETQIIRLVHYTTQEYFRRNGDIILASAQQDIAISCLTYLLYEEFGKGWVVDEEIDKYEYTLGDEGDDEDEDEDTHEGADEDVDEGDDEDEDTHGGADEDVDEGDDEDADEDTDEGEGQKLRGLPFKISLKKRAKIYPFLKYAARHWPTHAIVCGQMIVKELTLSFAKDDRKVSSANQVILALDGRYAYKDDKLYRDIDQTKSRSPLSAMHVISYLGCEALISELLNHGFEADAEDSTHRTPLWWAAWKGHEALVILLLSQSHVNVNIRGHVPNEDYNSGTFGTPLCMLAASGKDKTVKLLIEREDVDVNLPGDNGEGPLCLAAERGHSIVVATLLTRRDIEVNSSDDFGWTPLSLAANNGHKDIVKQLLKQKNIQVNFLNGLGESPLTLAAFRGHENIVEILLRHSDIEVNLKDKGGATTLHHAASGGHAAIVELLLGCFDIDINSKDNSGCTPLHRAADQGVSWLEKEEGPEYGVVLKMLLGHVGIEVNSIDVRGRTPLAQAALDGHVAAVKLLCACSDVDLDRRNNEGRNILAQIEKDQYLERWIPKKKYTEAAVREECLDILRAAIEARSQHMPQPAEITLS